MFRKQVDKSVGLFGRIRPAPILRHTFLTRPLENMLKSPDDRSQRAMGAEQWQIKNRRKSSARFPLNVTFLSRVSLRESIDCQK